MKGGSKERGKEATSISLDFAEFLQTKIAPGMIYYIINPATNQGSSSPLPVSRTQVAQHGGEFVLRRLLLTEQ